MLTPQSPENLPVLDIGESGLSLASVLSKEQVEEAEATLIQAIANGDLKRVFCELEHTFAPGVYMREIKMPAGSFIIGHEHRTTHINIVMTGSALVMLNGQPFRLEAPFTFVSEAGVRKVLFIEEDMRFITIHPTQETNLDKLEESLIVKSESFQAHIGDVQRLRELINEAHDQS